MNQRTKLLVQLGVLAAVATAGGLFAYYGVYQSDRVEAEKKEYTDRLFSPQQFGEKDVDGGSPNAEFTKLSVVAKNEITILERQPDGEWLITVPVQARADKLTVDGVVSQLQTQKFKRKLEDKPDDETLRRYGLQQPEFIIEATAEVGSAKTLRTTKLFGGAENTFDGSIYVRRDADPAVYQAEGGIRFSLQKSTFDLRSKQVMQVDNTKVVRIELKSKDNAWVLTRNDDKTTWSVELPCPPKKDPKDCGPQLADNTAVASIMSGLEAERAVSFLDATPEALESNGLLQPAVDATVTHENGSTVRLRVTRPAKDAGVAPYLVRDDSIGQTLAEVSSNAPGQLDRNAFDLKDHSITPLKREAVKKIIVHPPAGDDIVLEADTSPDAGNGLWRMSAPKSGPAKSFKVSSLLWTIGALKYTSVSDPNPKDWAKFGLDSKASGYTFFDADGKELGRFVIGNEVAGKPNIRSVRGMKDLVLETDASRFSELPFALTDFLDAPPPAVDAGPAGDAGE